MISTKKLIKMARNWQVIASIKRKRISLPQNNEGSSVSSCSSSLTALAEKGHFVAYTADGNRYSIPIACLQSSIFRELFKMSEEEYGIPNGCPITFPCDSIFIDYMISLSQQKTTTKDAEEALLLSIDAYRCSSSCTVYQQQTSQHVLVF